jgi:hypothetical protein
MEQPGDRWLPSGVVTLMTDFGLSDPYVGVMKGVLLGSEARPRLVDLTHGIAAQDVRAGAFHLAHSWRWFPSGSVHVAVVDPGVGSERRILVAREDGHAFLAPDNGLLGPVLSGRAEVHALDVERFSLPARSRTFHGRDVFAPAASRLVEGLDPAECGPAVDDWERIEFPTPRFDEAGDVLGEVLVADGFGNLVTNVPADHLRGEVSAWTAHLCGVEAPLVGAYAEAGPGEVLALVDSLGFWEVAVREGDAADQLGAGPGTTVTFKQRSEP